MILSYKFQDIFQINTLSRKLLSGWGCSLSYVWYHILPFHTTARVVSLAKRQ